MSDGAFLPAPVRMGRLLLAPAERAEILVDLSADQGRTLNLRSFNSANGTTLVPPPLQDQWDSTDFDLLEIRVGSFMYHCHILEHEDVGMMGQFVVESVAP